MSDEEVAFSGHLMSSFDLTLLLGNMILARPLMALSPSPGRTIATQLPLYTQPSCIVHHTHL